jgi:hypothetical protein
MPSSFCTSAAETADASLAYRLQIVRLKEEYMPVKVGDFTYDAVALFREGLAQAMKDDKQFHIRRDGSPAYMERYDWVAPFHQGLAWVEKDFRVFQIRPDGSRVD